MGDNAPALAQRDSRSLGGPRIAQRPRRIVRDPCRQWINVRAAAKEKPIKAARLLLAAVILADCAILTSTPDAASRTVTRSSISFLAMTDRGLGIGRKLSAQPLAGPTRPRRQPGGHGWSR